MTTSDLHQLMLDIASNNELDIIKHAITNSEVEEPLRVAFLGEFSTGKSTLVNALLKRNLLPMWDIPTNAVITEIQKGTENRVEVVRQIDGKDHLDVIELYELADEVVKAEDGKVIKIQMNDIDFLGDNIVLIDTPGLSSINDTHTDVTYGYLPFIDAAVLAVSALSGDATASLLTFIESMLKNNKDLKDRLYFCVTKLDLVEPEKRDSVLVKITSSLSKYLANPRISVVSPKDVLALANCNDLDSYNKTAITDLIQFIKVEIPEKRKDILDRKHCRILFELKQGLIEQLKFRMVTLEYTTPELDAQIKLTKEEIENQDKEVTKLNVAFNKVKDKSYDQIKDLTDSLIDVIAYKAAKDIDYSGDIIVFADNVRGILDNNMKIINLPNQHGYQNLGDSLSSKLSSSIELVKKSIDMAIDAITIIATAFIIPGAGAADAAGAAAVVIEKAGEAAKASKFVTSMGKFMKGLGHVVKSINPLERIGDLIKEPIIKMSAKSKLNTEMRVTLSGIFDLIQTNLDEYVEINYRNPQQQKYETLTSIRSDKQKHIADIDMLRDTIKKDIESLNKNNC